MLLFSLIGCFQISEEEWQAWIEQSNARVDVEISPETEVYTGTELSCSASAVNMDGAGEAIFFWTSNGAEIATGPVYTVSAADLDVEDMLSCSASITNGSGITFTGTKTLEIENSSPTISALSIQEETVFNDSTITCVAEVSDIDEQELTVSYLWFSGTENLGEGETLDISTTDLMPEDTVFCSITAADGYDSTIEDSDPVTIENRPPSAPTLSLSWIENQAYPLEGNPLNCEAAGAVDPDGQELSYTYAWSSNTGRNFEGASIPNVEIVSGEVWTCTGEVTDGIVSEQAEASITVCDSLFQDNCISSLSVAPGTFIDMSLIPAGQDPLERYTLTNSFYIMQLEVTQSLFEQIMGYSCLQDMDTSDNTGSFGVGPDYPAYHVNWYMAADFTNHLTRIHNQENGTNLQECYTCGASDLDVVCIESMNPYECDGYRLPTSAEWEVAARSGTTGGFWTPDGGGDESGYECTGTETIVDGITNPLLGEYAWYCGNSDTNQYPYGAKEVAQLLPNGFGLYDMNGNVREWVGDYHDYTASIYGENPYDDDEDIHREYRSGSWLDYPYSVTATVEHGMPPDLRNNINGLRVARGQ